jgi:hypothetical protein
VIDYPTAFTRLVLLAVLKVAVNHKGELVLGLVGFGFEFVDDAGLDKDHALERCFRFCQSVYLLSAFETENAVVIVLRELLTLLLDDKLANDVFCCVMRIAILLPLDCYRLFLVSETRLGHHDGITDGDDHFLCWNLKVGWVGAMEYATVFMLTSEERCRTELVGVDADEENAVARSIYIGTVLSGKTTRTDAPGVDNVDTSKHA